VSRSAAQTPDPRVTRTRAAVRAAVRRLVREAGFEAVTHQRVAATAGVGRASVYRHWPDRVDLLLDALAEVGPQPAWSSSGDLATDLTRELGRLQRILNDSPFVPELVALIGRGEWDPPVRDLKQRLLRAGTDGLRRALEHGIARGDLPPAVDVDDAIARLAGPLFYLRLLADRTIDDAFVGALIADVIHPPLQSRVAPDR
jgi:AcrR family transcriptional regulator